MTLFWCLYVFSTIFDIFSLGKTLFQILEMIPTPQTFKNVHLGPFRPEMGSLSPLLHRLVLVFFCVK